MSKSNAESQFTTEKEGKAKIAVNILSYTKERYDKYEMERKTSQMIEHNSKRSPESIKEYLDSFSSGSFKYNTCSNAALMHVLFDVDKLDKDYFKTAMKYFKNNRSRLVCEEILAIIEQEEKREATLEEPSHKIGKRLEKAKKVILENEEGLTSSTISK